MFDYDVVSRLAFSIILYILLKVQTHGTCSNRRPFSLITDEAYGEPDGLCMDNEDGIWSARWQAGKVVRFSPGGTIDVEIDFPAAWHITCVVFGGAFRFG